MQCTRSEGRPLGRRLRFRPPEQTTTLQLIRPSSDMRAHRTILPGNAVGTVFRALREGLPVPH
jgi:hypothetical protein